MKKYLALLASVMLLTLNAQAQTTYPSKPVKLMVGAGAGGRHRHHCPHVGRKNDRVAQRHLHC